MKISRSSRLRHRTGCLQINDAARKAPHSKRNQLGSLALLGLVLSLSNSTASASMILFSDLGGPGNLYNDASSQAVCGTGACSPDSFAIANAFTASGSGTLTVTQVDVAVGNLLTPATFGVSIWTDLNDTPGSMVSNALWTPIAATATACCANLVTIPVSGVNLVGGQTYFLVISPMSASDDSYNEWFDNSTNTTGLVLMSSNGGTTWSNAGMPNLQAFDVLGNTASATPEPGSSILFGTGALALLYFARRWRLIGSRVGDTQSS